MLNAGQKYCRMLPLEHSAILQTCIKLLFVIKIFVLSVFEWPFYTGFTVNLVFDTTLTFLHASMLAALSNFFKIIFQEYIQSFKQYIKVCSELFAKVTSRHVATSSERIKKQI